MWRLIPLTPLSPLACGEKHQNCLFARKTLWWAYQSYMEWKVTLGNGCTYGQINRSLEACRQVAGRRVCGLHPAQCHLYLMHYIRLVTTDHHHQGLTPFVVGFQCFIVIVGLCTTALLVMINFFFGDFLLSLSCFDA